MNDTTKPVANAPGFSLAPSPLARKPELSGGSTEALALRATVAMMNDPALTGADIPSDERAANLAVLQGAGQAIPTGGDKLTPPAPVAAISPPAEKAPERIFFTGRLAVGKDYVAAAGLYPVIGFADPIYALAETFFKGVTVNAATGKDAPGMREFLQAVGQWGRGEVSPQYPYSPIRAIFLVMIRSLAASGALPARVAWNNFGTPDFWIDTLLARAEGAKRLAITNCRFENEFTRLRAAGWTHYHIICHTTTWAKRLAEKRLTVDAPAVKDISERLAGQLDSQVMHLLSREKSGAKLRVIWNDTVPSPSARLYTLDEFLSV